MSKISTYPSADAPLLLSDRLIGTEAIRTPPTSTPLATKNFSLQELLTLFSANFPAPSLQQVLDIGNTAIQNISLTGTITTNLIVPTNIEDALGSQGTNFQFLSKATSGINWVNLPVDNLQAVLNSGNTATQNVYITGDITSTKIIPGNIQDDTSSIGTAGQVLSKTSSGIRWITNPASYTAGLNDVLLVGNTATNDINLNGIVYANQYNFLDSAYSVYGSIYLDSEEFILKTNSTDTLARITYGSTQLSGLGYSAELSYTGLTANRVYTLPNASGTIALTSDIPTPISLTTTGTSGPSTLIANTLNIPDYSAGISGTIPHTTASGTDTYTATVSGVTSYSDGNAYLVRFTNGNTTGCTLNINGLGAIPLYRNNDGQLIGGDIWAGAEMLCVYNSTANTFQCIGTSPNSLFAYVTNAESVAITKGQPVYAFGGTGDRLTVKLAYNTSDATSAQTIGVVVTSSIAANQKGIIIIQGLLDGLNIFPTSTWADGDPIYLGSTAGSITKTKQYAPNHLVYLGFVTSASNGSAGRWYVRVQNGYELDELHNVQAQSPSVNDILYYFGGSPGQWKTASIPTVLGYTPFQLPSLTSGSVLFSNGTTIAQNNSNFFWDNTNNRLGIGTASPTGRLAIKTPGALSTDIALRVRNNTDTGDLLTVNGLGGLNITSSTSGGDKPISVSTSTGEVFYIRGFGDAIFSGNVWLGVVNGTNRIGPGSMIITSSQGTGTAFATFTHNNSNIALRILSNSVIQLNPTAGNVLVGTTTDVASSKLTVESTTQGFLPPRMTTAQKNAIASPAAGLIVYDTTLNKLCVRGASSWETITSI